MGAGGSRSWVLVARGTGYCWLEELGTEKLRRTGRSSDSACSPTRPYETSQIFIVCRLRVLAADTLLREKPFI